MTVFSDVSCCSHIGSPLKCLKALNDKILLWADCDWWNDKPLNSSSGSCQRVWGSLTCHVDPRSKIEVAFSQKQLFPSHLVRLWNPVLAEEIWIDPRGTIHLLPAVQWTNFCSQSWASSHPDGNLEQCVWRRLVDVPVPIYSPQWAAGWRKLSGFRLAGPGLGVGWLCHVSGSREQPHPDAAREVSEAALVSLHAPALLRDLSACSEVASVFISAPHSALV